MPNNRPPTVMTIAGSDSGGGAGIQADLKTFSAMGVFGTSTLTAITAQNTVGVSAVHEIPTDVITAQIDAVVTDIGADAVKTGMLSSSDIVETVAEAIRRHGIANLVVDPVMVAKSGDRLLREEAIQSICNSLIPLAAVVTPNIPEAEDLTGLSIASDDDVREAAMRIVAMGARAVVVKGGHREGPPTDVLYDGSDFQEFTDGAHSVYEHPRDRLHLRFGGCGRTGARTGYALRGSSGERLRNRRHSRLVSNRAGSRAVAPFPRILVKTSLRYNRISSRFWVS